MLCASGPSRHAGSMRGARCRAATGMPPAIHAPRAAMPAPPVFMRMGVAEPASLASPPVVADAMQDMVSRAALQVIVEGVLIAGVLAILMSASQKSGPMSMIRSRATEIKEGEMPDVAFHDVAACDDAKQDLQEIVEFLKTPEKYAALGARIPRGVLLVGPPGCGKTLLAKAVAGEAKVPFFATSGSEFLEMFVGVGASRMRDLFARAKKQSPCIVFVDEIDAIGKQRTMNPIGGGDERDQTLNQLLVEMDGFLTNETVIVLAATNRPEFLDEALLRPGRFDRKITIDRPDAVGREAILGVHAKGKPLEPDVSLNRLARRTAGFSGADLANLLNEAAIDAARHGAKAIATPSLERALDKVLLGAARPVTYPLAFRRVLAYHEAGHALLGILVSDFDHVRKISIVPRANAGGVTIFEPTEDRHLYTYQYMCNKIIVTLGGRAAEELVFGTRDATTGAYQDFREATQLAKRMISEFGFNETLGKINVSDDSVLSSATGRDVADETKFLMGKLYDEAKGWLTVNEHMLHTIAKRLLEVNTLHDEDLVDLLRGIHCNAAKPATHVPIVYKQNG